MECGAIEDEQVKEALDQVELQDGADR